MGERGTALPITGGLRKGKCYGPLDSRDPQGIKLPYRQYVLMGDWWSVGPQRKHADHCREYCSEAEAEGNGTSGGQGHLAKRPRRRFGNPSEMVVIVEG